MNELHVELPAGEPEGAAAAIARKTPWWSVSLGIHVVAALLFMFFWVVPQNEIIGVTLVERLRRPQPPPQMVKDPIITPTPIPLARTVEDPVVTRENDAVNDDPGLIDRPTLQGDSMQFIADVPFKSRSSGQTIGAGANAGGDRGKPFGGRRRQRAQGGSGNVPRDSAVLEALRWLARHQSPDGSWGVQSYLGRCGRTHAGSCVPNPASAHADFDAGVTGLAVLAFLGSGYTHLSKDTHDGICFGDVVRQGLQWMMSHQDPEGCIGSRDAQKYMYNHTICALAMAEAYGLTGSGLFKDNAQRAVDFIVAAQNPGRGWRYSHKSGDNDTSVTGWGVMALKSAELSGLTFPRAAYDGSRAWLDEVTEQSYGRAGYNRRDTGKVYIPGLNEHFDHHEALTAIAVMSRIFIDRQKSDPSTVHGAELLVRDLPRFDGNATDFYYWYYASLALFQYDGPKGPLWSKWEKGLIDALVKPQNGAATACRQGSWEPVDRWSCEGGRVYATAINALTLEVYYRYDAVFTGKNR